VSYTDLNFSNMSLNPLHLEHKGRQVIRHPMTQQVVDSYLKWITRYLLGIESFVLADCSQQVLEVGNIGGK